VRLQTSEHQHVARIRRGRAAFEAAGDVAGETVGEGEAAGEADGDAIWEQAVVRVQASVRGHVVRIQRGRAATAAMYAGAGGRGKDD